MEGPDEARYPTYKQLGKEIASGLEFDSLDLVEAKDPLMELIETRMEEVVEERLAQLSKREQQMVVLDYLLSNGIEVKTTVMGTPVTITPVELTQKPKSENPNDDENPDGGGKDGGPDGGDPEPRQPLFPLDSAAAEIEEPIPQGGLGPLEPTGTLIRA